jgi:hypothetical protein
MELGGVDISSSNSKSILNLPTAVVGGTHHNSSHYRGNNTEAKVG